MVAPYTHPYTRPGIASVSPSNSAVHMHIRTYTHTHTYRAECFLFFKQRFELLHHRAVQVIACTFQSRYDVSRSMHMQTYCIGMIYIYIYIYIHTYIHTYTCIYTCSTCMWERVCVCECVCVCVCVCVYIYIYIYIYYTCIHMYKHAYIHVLHMNTACPFF